MMGGRKDTGFLLLENLLAVALLAMMFTGVLYAVVHFRAKHSFLEANRFGQNLAIRSLETQWSLPLGVITNAPINWSTQAVHGASTVTVTVNSVIAAHKVSFTSQSFVSVVNFASTNAFTATRNF